MCGGCTRLLGFFVLASLVCGKHLSFAMVHRFLRHGKAKNLFLFSKAKSKGIFNFVCYWMGFMFAEVL